MLSLETNLYVQKTKAMEKTITVIDLGTTKVVCLAGKQTPCGLSIIAATEAPSQGVKRGEVVNNQQVLASLNPVLKEMEEKLGTPVKEVIVGIAGRHIRCQATSTTSNRPKQTEEITAEEIEQMRINMFSSRVDPGEEVLHVIPQSYHVDDNDNMEPVGMYGSTIQASYRLFIGKSLSAEYTKRCIENAGLKLNQLILEPLASAAAVLQDDEKELGVALVDIGGGTTDVLVYHDNIVRHTAVIPFGGNSITEDIHQGCDVTHRQAEQFKIQYGSAYADLAPENKTLIIPGIGGREQREINFRFLANIIEARVDEIIEAVMYEIRQSGYADRIPGGIVLTGGGSLLSNLTQFIKYKTGYDARVARSVNVNIADECTDDINVVTYSCAIGLMMKGFEPAEASHPKLVEELVENQETVFSDSVKRQESYKAEKRSSSKRVEKAKEPKEPKEKVKSLGIFDHIGKFFIDGDNEA